MMNDFRVFRSVNRRGSGVRAGNAIASGNCAFPQLYRDKRSDFLP
jgi:hypothetical protein